MSLRQLKVMSFRDQVEAQSSLPLYQREIKKSRERCRHIRRFGEISGTSLYEVRSLAEKEDVCGGVRSFRQVGKA